MRQLSSGRGHAMPLINSEKHLPFAFYGTKRFEVHRKIGEGGMGVVYEALDTKRNVRVALKTLRFQSADTLLRFKDEYRSFQHLEHPNLINLGELYQEQDVWFFTMDLIDGSDAIKFLRERNDSQNKTLVNILIQLTEGLLFLHQSGKVHRDIKPSNILVTDSGKVILLDYGLASDFVTSDVFPSSKVVGTPAYMAPEQANGEKAGPAADWYSVGVLLYEALTQQLPFTGAVPQLLQNKAQNIPEPPRALQSQIPIFFDDLCMRLMVTDPNKRLLGRELLILLQNFNEKTAVPIAEYADVQKPKFVGRTEELSRLWSVFQDVRDAHRARSIYLCGDSGVGKSATLSQFLQRVRKETPNAIVLLSRCYQHEAIRYKAIDGAIDALSRYLVHLPRRELLWLLPPHMVSLARVFPVLWKIDELGGLTRAAETIDPQELRSQAISSLKDILRSLQTRAPVVIAIDDLHWSDPDSVLLIDECLHSPDAPGVMLVATYRTPVLKAHRSLIAEGQSIDFRQLSDHESQQLVSELVQLRGISTSVDLPMIIRQAEGNPFFLEALVQYVSELNAEPNDHPLQLEEVLRALADRLDAEAREILELTSLAAKPISEDVIAHAARFEQFVVAKQIKRLKALRLVRGVQNADDERIEPYHDRVKEAISSHIPPARCADYHLRIATALEASGEHEPEMLMVHWIAVGDDTKSLMYLELAAEKAERGLAFDRSVQLYKQCLERVSSNSEKEWKLHVKLADSLANVGQSREAAEAYRLASSRANLQDGIELRRRATEQWFRSGCHDEGLQELKRLFADLGIWMPKSRVAAYLSFFWGRLYLRLRGFAFNARSPDAVERDDLVGADVLWTAAISFMSLDQMRAGAFQSRHLMKALKIGEPSRVTRALALESMTPLAIGESKEQRRRMVLKRAEFLAPALPSNYARALIATVEGSLAYLDGNWAEAYSRSAQAEEAIGQEAASTAWEIAALRRSSFWSLCYLGAVDEPAKLVQANVKTSLAQEDVYATTSIHLSNFSRSKDSIQGASSRKLYERVSIFDWLGLDMADPIFEEIRNRDRLIEIRDFVTFVSVALAPPIVIIFWGADRFYAPHRKFEFLAVRLLIIPTSIIVVYLMQRKATTLFRAQLIGLAYAGHVTSLITYMIFRTEGPSSPYYAGLNLIGAFMLTNVPWTFVFAALNVTIVYAPFLLISIFFAKNIDYSTFVVNLYFIGATIVVSFVGRYLSERLRKREIESRLLLQREIKSRESPP